VSDDFLPLDDSGCSPLGQQSDGRLPAHLDAMPRPEGAVNPAASRFFPASARRRKARPTSLRWAHFLLQPGTRYALCWLVTLITAGIVLYQAWTFGKNDKRADGNWAYASIDFGGQWIMGRMIVDGHGRHLYDRNYQRMVLQTYFHRGNGDPTEDHSDAQKLAGWTLGEDDDEALQTIATFATPLAASDPLAGLVLVAAGQSEGVWSEEKLDRVVAPHLGGPLYPPVHAIDFVPLGLLPPLFAYRTIQLLTFALIFLNGWLICCLSHRRVWWPLATLALMAYPGLAGAINLGQNPLISLTVLLAGWLQLRRGRPVLAGLLWALLAFKPVWAISFFLVPLLTARWRMALAMGLGGLAQIALTLPIVGWHTWMDWLKVGQEASYQYTIQENWIFLSRDLVSIPRRWLSTFEDNVAVDTGGQLPVVLGTALWLGVVALTVAVVLCRRRPSGRAACSRPRDLVSVRALEGPPAAFVLLGAYFSCYHFMYYDVLLSILPLALLFTDPVRYLRALSWLRPLIVVPAGWFFGPEGRRYFSAALTPRAIPPELAIKDGPIPVPVAALALVMILPPLCILWDPTHHYPPLDTFTLLLLWAWCGYLVGRHEALITNA
jgi:arabinofuranan 3-O-arabinosyltransferase